MELLITKIVESLLVPPGIGVLLLFLGIVFLGMRPQLGKIMLWSGLLISYLLSTPYISEAMMRQLQRYPAIAPGDVAEQAKRSKARAIVILAGNSYKKAPEYGNDTVGDATLVRVRYGAYLHRITGFPLIVSGGHVLNTNGATLAEEMADCLRHDYGIQDVWREGSSRTTAENAIFTAKLLESKGIDTVLLVTHAYHMSRAVKIFERQGLNIIPAPTVLRKKGDSGEPWMMLWLPSASSLYKSSLVVHELLGMAWYAIRY